MVIFSNLVEWKKGYVESLRGSKACIFAIQSEWIRVIWVDIW